MRKNRRPHPETATTDTSPPGDQAEPAGGGWWVVLSLLGLVVVLAILGRWLPVSEWVAASVQPIRDLGAMGMVAFVGLYVAGVVVLFPGLPMTLAAGLLYGPYLGTALVSASSTTGALIAFLLSRTMARNRVRRWVDASARLRRIDRALGDRGAWVVLLLRLSPLVPFNLLNYALGVSGVRLLPYAAASVIGMFPATVVYVMIGSSLGLSTKGMTGWGYRAITIAATVAASVGLGIFARSALREIERQSS